MFSDLIFHSLSENILQKYPHLAEREAQRQRALEAELRAQQEREAQRQRELEIEHA